MDLQALSDTITQLHWVDHIGLGVAAVFLLLGLWRGLWWQVIRLLGLSAAVAVARLVGPIWGEDLHNWTDLGPDVTLGLGWFSAFLLTLIGAAFLGMVGNRTIDALKLSLVNRFFGGLVGLITGVLLHSAAVWALSAFASDSFQAQIFNETWTGDVVGELIERASVLPEFG